jgi:hypothetical protein
VTKTINLTLKVWRQNGPKDKGRFDTYRAENISTDMSFLEMLDVVNDQLTIDGKEPIAFDHDCREGICGQCGCVVNGRAHGAEKGTTLCQLHMRHFDNGDTIAIEPFRAMAFKVIKDLAVDRSALDKIIQAGGYVSVNTGGAQDANAILVPSGSGGPGNGRGAMHRLRCLRGVVPQCLGHALYQCQSVTIGATCPRENPKRPNGRSTWSGPWMSWVLATAPMKGNAKPNAPKRSPLPILPG